ncbi:MAG: hypothetical protein J6P05_07180, partial [Lachnospiraceae bacterium]|nr:hypothetical protein [Lachnospiraceae bacterium]
MAAASIIALIICCAPLFTVNCVNGDDVIYHLLRIDALKTGIEAGCPFLRINMLFFGGEGYASSLFYPDFLLYVPAALRVMGLGINASFHIFLGLCIIATFASVFFSIKYITGDRFPAVVGAIALTLSEYHLGDIYKRAALGEVTAFIFIPLVLAGIYSLIFDEFRKPQFLGLGMAGVLLCHTFSFVLCLGLNVVGYLFFLWRQLLQKKGQESLETVRKATAALAITAMISAALTCFYWLPMMEQIKSGEFRYSIPSFDVFHERMLFKDIFTEEWPSMGIGILVLLLPGIFLNRRYRISSGEGFSAAPRYCVEFADLCSIMGFILILSTTGLFPWKRFSESLSFVQFPWRLFIGSSILFAFAGGIYVWAFIEEYKGASLVQDGCENIRIIGQNFALSLVLALFISTSFSNMEALSQGYYSYSDDYFDFGRYTEEVIGGEWLPLTVKSRHRLTDDAGLYYDSNKNKRSVNRTKNSLSIEGLKGDERYVDVPFVYYLGYAARNEKGEKLALDGSGENGRVRVYPDGASSIIVTYDGTLLQHLADIVSSMTLLM